MKNWRAAASLLLTYFTFAILLNSVGSVILQSVNYFGVTKTAASTLEGFKDLPIAIVSFMVASFLPRFGYRNSMMLGLGIVTLASIVMIFADSFWATRLLFLCVGVSFALVKVSAYSSIGLLVSDSKRHAGFMNTLEGLFMVGVLSGYWLFGYFIGDDGDHSGAWLNVYWVLAGLSLFNIFILLITPFDESGAKREESHLKDEFLDMLRLLARPLVYVFVISAFLYVLIEQGVGTWLPTFNQEILKLPPGMSVQAASIFAAGLAIGRLSAGAVLTRVSWFPTLCFCIIAMAVLVLSTLPLTHGIVVSGNVTWLNAPIAAYIFPMIGLFMAPIYPAINSVMLSALPKHQHASMTGLIVIFSALGGTTGSLITGLVFQRFDGQTAFYFSLVPMTVILLTLYLFKREVDKAPALEPA
ncbi:MAG: MFS transporter [Sphingomonadales bacterium]